MGTGGAWNHVPGCQWGAGRTALAHLLSELGKCDHVGARSRAGPGRGWSSHPHPLTQARRPVLGVQGDGSRASPRKSSLGHRSARRHLCKAAPTGAGREGSCPLHLLPRQGGVCELSLGPPEETSPGEGGTSRAAVSLSFSAACNYVTVSLDALFLVSVSRWGAARTGSLPAPMAMPSPVQHPA